jgi:hypothetical protein
MATKSLPFESRNSLLSKQYIEKSGFSPDLLGAEAANYFIYFIFIYFLYPPVGGLTLLTTTRNQL